MHSLWKKDVEKKFSRACIGLAEKLPENTPKI